MSVPVISFIGWSGSGKTTFLEKLIPLLRAEGLRVAVIKHDGHDFQMDTPGKDTWRFTQAGAEAVAIANTRHAAALDSRPGDFDELCRRVGSVDLILAEGWTDLPLPQIEVFRTRDTLRCPDTGRLLALITDRETDLPVPVYALDDYAGVCRCILDYCAAQDACWLPYARLHAGQAPAAPAVQLTVDGRQVPLLPFVQQMLAGALRGMVAELKDTGYTAGASLTLTLTGEDGQNG